MILFEVYSLGRKFYRFCRGIARIFTGRMKTEWEEPFVEGPCVFAVNHDGANGPILMCTEFPLRDQCHPWINAPVFDRKAMPEYVRNDFWWKPGCFGEPVIKHVVPRVASWIIPPLMKGADGVPIYRDQRIMTTFRESVKLLKQGEKLVIFADGIDENGEYKNEIHSGWLALGELFYKSAGQALRIYPVHVCKQERCFYVSKPVFYDPSRRFRDQEQELAAKIAPGLGKTR